MHARNFTTNVPKILDLKSSSGQIFSRKLSLGAPESLVIFIPLICSARIFRLVCESDILPFPSAFSLAHLRTVQKPWTCSFYCIFYFENRVVARRYNVVPY